MSHQTRPPSVSFLNKVLLCGEAVGALLVGARSEP